jgi:hypothetical protein
MAGKPLLANFQSGVFYPLNILLFVKPFFIGWSAFVFLQQILAALFLYLYLNNLKIDRRASAFGALVWIFSGFFTAWLEWGNIIHTILWLPLILLSIDKVVNSIRHADRSEASRWILRFAQNDKQLFLWSIVYVLSLVFSFFAGSLQIFFYLFIFSAIYFVCRWYQFGLNKKVLLSYILLTTSYLLLTAIQWLPTLQFINLSARAQDRAYVSIDGWFIPFRHLIQFLAPDFFGNPATLNYWGTWNYGELVGYIGMLPLLLALFAIAFRRDKKTLFYTSAVLGSLLFAFPTWFAQIPFLLHLPFLSTAQPTRLLALTTFALAVLASFGFERVINSFAKKQTIVFYQLYGVLLAMCLGLLFIWTSVIFKFKFLGVIDPLNWSVAKHNLILPTALFSASLLTIVFLHVFKSKRAIYGAIILFFLLTFFDLYRFSSKFLPFTDPKYFFPNTKTISYLQQQTQPVRVASLQNEIMAPNFSTTYHIQSIEGYDPLYLKSYAQYISALEKGNARDQSLISFNRIITPHNTNSPLFNLLNSQYVLSIFDTDNPNLQLVAQEGETRVYKNTKALPRVFSVTSVVGISGQQKQIEFLYSHNLHDAAVIEGSVQKDNLTKAVVEIKNYSEDQVVLQTKSSGESFIVLTDVYYPTWKVYVDGVEAKLYKTDYAFRGLFVPSGEHRVEFRVGLF